MRPPTQRAHHSTQQPTASLAPMCKRRTHAHRCIHKDITYVNHVRYDVKRHIGSAFAYSI